MARPTLTRYPPPVPVVRPPQGTTYAREAAGNTLQALTAPVPSYPATPAPAFTGFQGFTPDQRDLAVSAAQSPLGRQFGSSRILSSPLGGGGATIAPVQSQLPQQNGSGIYVNGVTQVKGAKGNFAADPNDTANAPGTVSPAQKFAADQAVILAEHPEIGVAGSEANKKFLQAYKDSGNDQGSILATARQAFGVPTQTPNAVNPKDADAALIPAAIAKGNAVAANPPPSAAQKAGAAIPNAVGNAVGTVGSSYNSGVQSAADFATGLTGSNAAGQVVQAALHPINDAKQVFSGFVNNVPADAASRYGEDTSNMGADFFNSRANAPAAPSPTGPRVGPPTNSLATATSSPSLTPTQLASTPNTFAPQPLSLNAGVAPLSAPTLTTPAAPVVDPDELKRRQAAAQASNS